MWKKKIIVGLMMMDVRPLLDACWQPWHAVMMTHTHTQHPKGHTQNHS